MDDLVVDANAFIDRTIDFFDLSHDEVIKYFECSTYFFRLTDNLFTCRILYDCIDKGITYHTALLDQDVDKISKQIDPTEASKIIGDFKELVDNKDLISILAYEFFINYLDTCIRNILQKNVKLLKKCQRYKL
jgi:hypothetical protein